MEHNPLRYLTFPPIAVTFLGAGDSIHCYLDGDPEISIVKYLLTVEAGNRTRKLVDGSTNVKWLIQAALIQFIEMKWVKTWNDRD